jgi:methionine sulfoxide reductase heme-binding subunit
LKRFTKPVVFAASLLPLANLVRLALTDGLGANPIEYLLNALGFWTLVFVMATLACTPFKIVAGWNWPLRVRRMLGLFAFFYGVAHWSTYVGLDQFFDLDAILEDIGKRPFILVGSLALLLMLPLAITSTNRMVKRLGFERWKGLHRLVYATGVLGVLHFILRVKADYTEPIIFGAVLTVLLAIRLLPWWQERRRSASASPAASRATP